MSTSTTIHLASVASALGSSALVLPFSAGLAFFVLGALFATAFFLASTAAGFGFNASRAEVLLGSEEAGAFALPMFSAGNEEKCQENTAAKMAFFEAITDANQALTAENGECIMQTNVQIGRAHV